MEEETGAEDTIKLGVEDEGLMVWPARDDGSLGILAEIILKEGNEPDE